MQLKFFNFKLVHILVVIKCGTDDIKLVGKLGVGVLVLTLKLELGCVDFSDQLDESLRLQLV